MECCTCIGSAEPSTASSPTEIIEDPARGGARATTSACCSACEAAVERLATDRHYFAHPSRTLFNDIRTYFPMASQLRVLRVIERYLGLADEYLAACRRPGSTSTATRSQCRATHAQGHAVPADAAAAQRLLPVAPAPRRDRGARGAAGRLGARPRPREGRDGAYQAVCRPRAARAVPSGLCEPAGGRARVTADPRAAAPLRLAGAAKVTFARC